MSESKRAAGRAAAERVQNGMVVGLGTGSTVFFTLERLGERVAEEGLSIRGIPTSVDTATKAEAFGIPMVGFEDVSHIDLTIDGADEIDGDYTMIKGGGGALLREKVVASLSKEVVIIVGPDKVVATLGASFPLPVEFVPFARTPVQRSLTALGAQPRLRMDSAGDPYLTDNGNEIFDCAFEGGIADAEALALALAGTPGIVESGLFLGLADHLVIGHDDGTAEERSRAVSGGR
jgi:ribose 5-phosphate isomerase A